MQSTKRKRLAKFAMTDENKETFEYLLHVNDELYDMLDDDTATLQHMMNTYFQFCLAKLKNPRKQKNLPRITKLRFRVSTGCADSRIKWLSSRLRIMS